MSEVLTQGLEMVSTFDVQPHPSNPRQGDVGAIITSMKKHGFFGALVVQRSTGYILAGNHRYLAALELGYSQVPVIYVDVDPWQATQILLVDNKTSDQASYDDAALANVLKEVLADVGDLEGTGFELSELDDLLKEFGGGFASASTDEDVVCPACGCKFGVDS